MSILPIWTSERLGKTEISDFQDTMAVQQQVVRLHILKEATIERQQQHGCQAQSKGSGQEIFKVATSHSIHPYLWQVQEITLLYTMLQNNSKGINSLNDTAILTAHRRRVANAIMGVSVYHGHAHRHTYVCTCAHTRKWWAWTYPMQYPIFV